MPRKTRLTLTEEQLNHLFITMDMICGAGSENPTDAELALLLARAMKRRALNVPSVEARLAGGWRMYRDDD